jgi:thiosulfate/3-mercaptopyruvate sulfurtransferase
LDLERDLSSPRGAHGGRHPLPALAQLSERLRSIGLNFGSLVVAYDDSRLAFAARLWWLLRYLGHERVQLLNGGFQAWIRADLPISTALPASVPGNFEPRPQPELVLDREAISALSAGHNAATRLIDARERKRYRGEEEPIDPVAGHIPRALCYPWQDFTSTDGRAISEEANRQRWAALEREAPLAVYCGSGVTACVDILSLYWAGFGDVKLYAGSFSDWCSYADAPIAVGDEPRAACREGRFARADRGVTPKARPRTAPLRDHENTKSFLTRSSVVRVRRRRRAASVLG